MTTNAGLLLLLFLPPCFNRSVGCSCLLYNIDARVDSGKMKSIRRPMVCSKFISTMERINSKSVVSLKEAHDVELLIFFRNSRNSNLRMYVDSCYNHCDKLSANVTPQ